MSSSKRIKLWDGRPGASMTALEYLEFFNSTRDASVAADGTVTMKSTVDFDDNTISRMRNVEEFLDHLSEDSSNDEPVNNYSALIHMDMLGSAHCAEASDKSGRNVLAPITKKRALSHAARQEYKQYLGRNTVETITPDQEERIREDMCEWYSLRQSKRQCAALAKKVSPFSHDFNNAGDTVSELVHSNPTGCTIANTTSMSQSPIISNHALARDTAVQSMVPPIYF